MWAVLFLRWRGAEGELGERVEEAGLESVNPESVGRGADVVVRASWPGSGLGRSLVSCKARERESTRTALLWLSLM